MNTNKTFSSYHMHKNMHMGNCLCIVYSPSEQEIKYDSLQAPYILILIKSKLDLSKIKVVEDLERSRIFQENSPVLLRIASECLFGMFGDSHCDCEAQRISSLREININGQGIYIHMPQEGQGNGLFYKAKELELQVNGTNQYGCYLKEKNVKDASEYLLAKGELLDKRKYESLKVIFNKLGFDKYQYKLISGNHDKLKYFKKIVGLKIDSLYDVNSAISIENAGEYLAKLYMKDFQISDTELQNIYFALFSAKNLPNRVISLLRYLEEDISHGRKFMANMSLLEKIVSLYNLKQNKKQLHDLEIFKDSISYTEYQTEISIKKDDLDLLFKKGILTNDESLHYEENYFYDLVYFKGIPARSLKIRKGFRLIDLNHPESLKLIYKIPASNKTYAIKSIVIPHEDVTNLIELSLRDYEIHFLPVFTHNLSTSMPSITVLLKRYSNKLRTLSLMGHEKNVRQFIKILNKIMTINEIDDPTNHRYIQQDISLDFDWNKLSKEELNIFRKYHNG